MTAITGYTERVERVSFWAQGVIDLEIKTGAFGSLPQRRLIQEHHDVLLLSKGEALHSPQVAACLPMVCT